MSISMDIHAIASDEMEAAMALMLMSSGPTDWFKHKPTSEQTDFTSVTTENCDCETQTDLTYEVPEGSNNASTRVSLDLRVKVIAGSSNQQSYGAGTSNTQVLNFEELPDGDENNDTRNDEEFPALPEATRLGKRSRSEFEDDFEGDFEDNSEDDLEDNSEDNFEDESTDKQIETRDVGTQTDYYEDPSQNVLERVLKLRAKKKVLLEHLKFIQEQNKQRIAENSKSTGTRYKPSESGSPISKCRCPGSRGSTSSNSTEQSFESDEDVEFKSEEISDIDEYDEDEEEENSPKSNVTMVPIGSGKAKVPLSLIERMDWTSYSYATRKLLTAVFPRKILATHSLSGKPSPAFPGKKAKTQLDPDLVNDIVKTVMEKCDISEGRIRSSITTKCADESKMYRNRMKKRRLQAKKENLGPHQAPPQCHSSGVLLPLNLSLKKN